MEKIQQHFYRHLRAAKRQLQSVGLIFDFSRTRVFHRVFNDLHCPYSCNKPTKKIASALTGPESFD